MKELKDSGQFDENHVQELSLWYQEQLQQYHDNMEGEQILDIYLIPKSFPRSIDL
jgi:hypothetical protein